MFFSKLIMVFPVMVVMVLDMAFTLFCQPDAYWQDYNSCNEANPIGKILLSFNPACFVVLFMLYAFAVLFLAVKTQNQVNIPLIAVAFAAHAHGSASWLPIVFQSVFSLKANEPCLYFSYLFAVFTTSALYFYSTKPLIISD